MCPQSTLCQYLLLQIPSPVCGSLADRPRQRRHSSKVR
jgi:hypothetical protein